MGNKFSFKKKKLSDNIIQKKLADNIFQINEINLDINSKYFNTIDEIKYIKSLKTFCFLNKFYNIVFCYTFPKYQRNKKVEEILGERKIENFFYLEKANKFVIRVSDGGSLIYSIEDNTLILKEELSNEFDKIIEINSKIFVVLESYTCSTYKFINEKIQKINVFKIEIGDKSGIDSIDVSPSKKNILISGKNYEIFLLNALTLKIISKYTNDISGDVYFLNDMIFIAASLCFFNLYNINNNNPIIKVNNLYKIFYFSRIDESKFIHVDLDSFSIYKYTNDKLEKISESYGSIHTIRSILYIEECLYIGTINSVKIGKLIEKPNNKPHDIIYCSI